MESDCLFCGGGLPISEPSTLGEGERTAYDPVLGRLWQVCSECGRWNLTPIESRWEALEECELVAARSRVLLETDHLALLSVGSGQLIRVGKPERYELASWRYSSRLDEFVRSAGKIRRVFMSLPELPVGGRDFYATERAAPAAWMGSPFLEHGALLTGLFLSVPLGESCPACRQPLFIHPAAFGDLQMEPIGSNAGLAAPCGLCGESVLVQLQDVRPALRAGLALVSRDYRDEAKVRSAIVPLVRTGGAHQLVRRLCARRALLGELPQPGLLALWIALDEIAEAEALEAEWKTAESIARIADDELTQIAGYEEFRQRALTVDLGR